VNQDEVESQLSAMYDGALPQAECELLSRRIDRDENLRARWSRYALIGAAMRSEPVATARSGFAARVSAALDGAQADAAAMARQLDGQAPPRASALRRAKARQGRNLLWSGALAATLVTGVAGLSVSMLRDAALRGPAVVAAAGPLLPTAMHSTATLPGAAPAAGLSAAQEASPAVVPSSLAAPRAPAMDATLMAASLRLAGHSPLSYVTPAGSSGAATILRTQLADYIVAHSAYSTPLLRRNVLSELVTSEEQMGIASSYTGAARAAQGTPAGERDAIRSTADATR